MNAGPPPEPTEASRALPELLQGGWWFGSASAAGCSPPARSVPAQRQPEPLSQEPALASWWWPFGSSGTQTSQPRVSPRGQNGAKPRLPRPRSAAATLDAAGKPQPRPRPARVASSGKLASQAQQAPAPPAAVADTAPGAALPASAADGASATTAAAAAGGGPPLPSKKPLGSRQQKEGGSKAPSKPGISKQLSYQERRRLWRERLEHAKAKAEKRAAAAAAAAAGGGEGSQHGSSAARKFSRHIAIPIAAATAAAKLGSAQTTPSASPKRPSFLGSESGGEQPQGPRPASQPGGSSPPPEFLDVPPVWQGFQTTEAPADFGACSEEQLRRFLAQAGRPGSWQDLAAAELAGAARDSRNAWEVERIMLACQWPQEVLRVPRHADPAALKAAYRRVSMQVHPDKNTAAGAADAFSIVADAYAILSMGQTAAAIPAFLRQNHPTRQSHLNPGATAAGAGPGAASMAGGPFGEAGPPPPPAEPPAHSGAADAAAVGAPGGGSSISAGGGGEGEGEGMLSHVSSFDLLGEQLQEQFFASVHRSTSEEAEVPSEVGPGPRPGQYHLGTESHEHWNPHGHLSSNEELSPAVSVERQSAAAAGQQDPSGPGPEGWAGAPGVSRHPSLLDSLAGSGGAQLRAGTEGQWDAGIEGAAPPQSPVPPGGASSRASTPGRPCSSTPSHSRTSSGQSFAGYEPAGPGTAPPPPPLAAAAQGSGRRGGRASHGTGGAAAGAGRGVAAGKPPPAQKIRVVVKYKTGSKAAAKE